jgi:3-oxoacyl-[acyl-carrier-protein] synthase III
MFKVIDSEIATDYSNNIRNNRSAFDRCSPDTMYAKDKVFFQQGRKVFKEVTPMVIKFISNLLGENGLKTSEGCMSVIPEKRTNSVLPATARSKMYNKFIKRTIFTTLRFGVASPLYPKTPLHKNCLL